ITANIVEILSGEHAGGGWDIRASQATTNPIGDFKLTLTENGANPDQFEASARVNWISPSRGQMRMAGAEEWKIYGVNGVDASFTSESDIPLQTRADGYATDRAVWDALAADPLLAVIDSMALPATGFDPDSSEFTIEGVTADDETMQPQQVAISDPATGRTRTVTVIGIIDSRAFTMWGMFLQEQTVEDVWGMPDAINYHLRLAPGVNADDAARTVESSLINYGVQADSIRTIVDETMATQRNMMRLFEGFMALGLIVGIAALGVIAFRSVVERRQQIGMLRAIGYKRSMVAASFLIESTMITLLGVLSGAILGVLLAWNLITSDYFIGGGGVGFIVPWLEMALFIVISLVASLLMAYIPSRRAAGVPIAQALRYE
ncbi:MAG TPA: FtsX-like permease family protein, partial [Thermomicrobiales bacterium]|nr:FtsX-like permease family protein [Thermomicrobiales bacterium]